MKLIQFTDCDGKMFAARADMISRIAPDPNRIGNTLVFLSTHAGEVAISIKGTFAMKSAVADYWQNIKSAS